MRDSNRLLDFLMRHTVEFWTGTELHLLQC